MAQGRCIAFLLLWLSAIVLVSDAAKIKFKETHMVFYLQDWATGENATAILVAWRKTISSPSNFDFGSIMVIDDALTKGPERNSSQVGRAQGIYVNSALNGFSLHMAFSIVFTSGKYKGSTLEIRGADKLLNSREVSVVSGTGAFRFARGYARLETSLLSGVNAAVKFDVTIRQYRTSFLIENHDG